MDNHEYVKQIDFSAIKDLDVDFIDEGIVLYSDFGKIPLENGSLQMNMVLIVACSRGTLQVDLNAISHTLHENEALVCLPSAIVNNWLLSRDFDGAVLCLSPRFLLEHFSENDIWETAFIFNDRPVVKTSRESLQMIQLYSAALKEKLKQKHSPYHKEIVAALVKAALYEMIGNVETDSEPKANRIVKHGDVLFKKFIELLSKSRIKPRNLSWYAEQLCVTPKYLSTVSKQVSGKTAFKWINEYVMVDIRFWLKSTNKSIKEIAYILEFPSTSFFGKYCRTHLGISPTEYRKQLRNTP
ncbi:MAG: helix-turn-helix domain-containing protein [Sodaliphilus sp.]